MIAGVTHDAGPAQCYNACSNVVNKTAFLPAKTEEVYDCTTGVDDCRGDS